VFALLWGGSSVCRFLHRQVPTFASDGGFKQEPSHGRSQLKSVLDDVMSARLFHSRVSKKRVFIFYIFNLNEFAVHFIFFVKKFLYRGSV